jgi:hypothetical protein
MGANTIGVLRSVVAALGLVVAGDLAYSNVHQYLADGGFKGGIDAASGMWERDERDRSPGCEVRSRRQCRA